MKIDFHVHPYFKNYEAVSLLTAMNERKLDSIGLVGFNRDIYEDNRKRFNSLKKERYKVDSDNWIIRVEDKNGSDFYFPRIGEYKNKEGFHLLVMGEQRNLQEDAPITRNIEEALAQESFVVIDHPFVALDYSDTKKEEEDFLHQLCKKYAGKIALEWNGYCVPLLRNIIDKGCIPLRAVGEDIHFGNVNKKLEDFAEELNKEGINCPIVADTDLHARNKRDLYLVGTSNIEADVKKRSGRIFVDSLKEKVFSRDYKIKKGYVDTIHFIFSYGIPVMLGKISKKAYESMKPRG